MQFPSNLWPAAYHQHLFPECRLLIFGKNRNSLPPSLSFSLYPPLTEAAAPPYTAWRSSSVCSRACIKLQGKGSYPGKHSKERGMEVGQLQRHWVDLMTSLFREGLLDDQYTQLQQLQDESNPDFVFEVVSLFFDDSEKLLNELTGVLNEQPLDFKKVDAHVHQLKGSSSSIGAQRVKNVCIAFRSFCEAKNHEGCLRCLQQVKQEYYLVKNKLQTLFRVERQISAAGGSVPLMT